ncbi:MAG: histidinol dehydrogenase [Bacteroidota bacterium]
MIKTIDFRRDKTSLDRITRRSFEDRRWAERRVERIVRDVKEKGDSAVREYTARFDGVKIERFKVDPADVGLAFRRAPDGLKRALKEATQNIRRFHARQLRKSWFMSERAGSRLGLQLRPIEKIGVYVPGGKAAYPSSVLMAVIPAQIAGVQEIHLVSPPDSNGLVNNGVLVAASLLGVMAVYRVGGAQAIAALAYGTQSIPKVDKIVGPGNLYVQTAKRIVFGDVGIDSFAGPSEIIIVADRTANAAFIAADLIAQAEHDERAMCLLFSTSRRLITDVKRELVEQVEVLPRRRIIKRALKLHGALVFVAQVKEAIDLVNLIAPEHLELLTRENSRLLRRIRNAGAIFLGEHSPVAVGDYFAGPNHVLPTAGSARFSSPLTVDDFVKTSSIVEYTRKRLNEAREIVSELATYEGLEAHRASIAARFSPRYR